MVLFEEDRKGRAKRKKKKDYFSRLKSKKNRFLESNPDFSLFIFSFLISHIDLFSFSFYLLSFFFSSFVSSSSLNSKVRQLER